MQILFLTRSPIRRENSTGNTLLNFFDRASGSLPTDWHYHALALRRGTPEPGFAETSLSFGDSDLARRFLRHTPLPPPRATADATPDSPPPLEESLYRRRESTTLRYLAYPLRDLLWSTGGWKGAVRDYVAAVKPDIIFFPTGGQGYHTRVLRYIRRLTDAPVILYHGDDHYTLSPASPNPLYYPRRLAERRRTRMVVNMCIAQFGASPSQCRAYEAAMGKPCTFLTKGRDFSAPPPPLPDASNRPLSFAYTGNIHLGRWDSLLYLARLLEALTAEGTPATLTVYSGNALTARMQKRLAETPALIFKGAVPAEAVPAIQAAADVLVHAEGFARTDRAIVRHSFSTKLVDYFHAARPIVAVGPQDVASVDYLATYDLALSLAGDPAQDLATLRRLSDVTTRRTQAERAYAFGREHHGQERMQGRVKHILTC